jgi:hypothetical protein
MLPGCQRLANISARVLRSALVATALAAAWGCGGSNQQEHVPFTTNDLQIDGSGEADVGSPRMCVANATVYAVWHDSRRAGRNQVFFNAGRGGGRSWSDSDTQLSADLDGLSRAENPAIACAGESVYVVWEDDRDSEFGNRNIYFTYSDDGGRTWRGDELGPNKRLTQDPDGDWDALSPQLSVDYSPEISVDQHVYITWYDGRHGAYDIYLTHSTNGVNFPLSDDLLYLKEFRLDTDAPGSAYSAHPLIASDGTGGVYVVWQDRRAGGNDVYANRSIDWGNNWGATDTRLDGGDAEGASDAFGLSLAVDRESSIPAVYAAWHDDRNGAYDIYLNYSLDAGGNWLAEATRIDNDAAGGSNSFYPDLTASDGRVLVAWHDDRDVGYDLYLRGSENGGETWGSSYRMDTDTVGSAHSLGARIARDESRVVVAWSDLRAPSGIAGEPHPDLYYRASQDGGFLWSDLEQRVDDDCMSRAISAEPQVAISGPFVYFLWVDYRLGNADLWFRSMDPAVEIVPPRAADMCS